MRDYGKLYSGFWTSRDVQSMSDDGKILAAYLLTCDHSTIIGCYRLPDGYVSDDLNWSVERVSKGFDELFEKGFATRNLSSKWVVIHKYIKWNQPENPNQVKAAIKAFNQVPDECGVKPALARSLKEFCTTFNAEILEPFLNPSETVAKPVVVTVTETVVNPPSLRDAPPKDSIKQKSQTFAQWLAEKKAKGEKAVSDYKPIWEFSKANGIPDDWIQIAWIRFVDRYTEDEKAKRKRYIDWRGVFLRAVKENWLGLWFYSESQKSYVLTTIGVGADLTTREAA